MYFIHLFVRENSKSENFGGILHTQEKANVMQMVNHYYQGLMNYGGMRFDDLKDFNYIVTYASLN